MKMCKRCSNTFKGWLKVNGKWRNLQRRVHCLDCIPFIGKAGNRINDGARYTRTTKNKDCVVCKRNFKPSRNYVQCCSIGCANTMTSKRKMVDWNARTLKESMNHSTPRTRYVHVRKHARKIMEASHKLKECEVCGFDIVVEVCHFKGIAEFTSNATLGEVNALSNLMYLCPNHHAMMDKGLLQGCDSVEK